MAQLTWQNIDTNFGGGADSRRGNLLAESMDPLAESLRAFQAKRDEKRSMSSVAEALKYTDPESYQRALDQGLIVPDKYNAEFLKGRTTELLAQQLAKINQTKAQAEITGQNLANENTGITIDQNRTDLEQDKTLFSQTQGERDLRDEVATGMSGLQAIVDSGDLKTALTKFDSEENQNLLAKAGIPLDVRDRLRVSLGEQYDTNLTRDTTGKKKIQDDAVNLIKFPAEKAKAIADAENEKRDAILEGNKDAETAAQDKIDAVLEPGKYAAAVLKQKTDEANTARDAAHAAAEDKVTAATDEVTAGAATLLEQNLNGGDLEDVAAKIQAAKGFSPAAKAKALVDLPAAYKAITPQGDPDALLAQQQLDMPAGTPGRPVYKYDTVAPGMREAAQSIIDGGAGGPRAAVQPGSQPGTIAALADMTEGNADYRTLYDNAQKAGGDFEGVDVTQMTVDQLDKFAKGGYGASVAKKNNGTFATPMGRFQIVNETLQGAMKEMGLDPKTTLFDAKTQNAVFNHLVQRRLSGPKTMEQKMTGLRQEWAGFKNIDDAALAAAIQNYEKTGDAGALMGGGDPNILGAGAEPGPNAPRQFPTTPVLDETYGADASAALAEFELKAADSPTGLNWYENKVVEGNVLTADQLSQKVDADLQQESNFGGQSPAIQAALTSKDNKNLVVGDVVEDVTKLFDDMDKGQVTDDINYMVEKYGMNAAAAATLVKSGVVESWWIFDEFLGIDDKRHIDRKKMDKYMSQFMDIESKDPNQKRAGLMSALEKDRATTTASSNLSTAMARTRETWASYAQLAARKAKDPSVDILRPYQKVKQALEAEERIRNSIAADKLLFADRNARNPGGTVEPPPAPDATPVFVPGTTTPYDPNSKILVIPQQ